MLNKQPESAQLCSRCIPLIQPAGVSTALVKLYDTWELLKKSSYSCKLCEILQTGYKLCSQHIYDRFPDVEDVDIGKLPLMTEFDKMQSADSGLMWREFRVYLTYRRIAWSHKYLMMACDSHAPCATHPSWNSFPTTYEEKMSTIRFWLEECESSHPECKLMSGGMPKRLIKVGLPGGPAPRLILCKNLTSQNIRYATLSYCWGRSPTVYTTKMTETAYSEELAYSTLPQTFQDALAISSALGINYIWIDSLCIVQDDQVEWKDEASKMHQIYSGATLTFAALEAKDSSEGFFFHAPADSSAAEDSSQRAFFVVHDSADSRRLVQIQARNEMPFPLHTRGWTLQENVLSPRVVQCVQSELNWKCRSGHQTETGVLLDPSMTGYGILPHLDLESTSRQSEIWWKWIESFSGRQFTYIKDRFPALLGLINQYQAATSDIPLLGLWKGSFHVDLLWMRIGSLQKPSAVPDYQSQIPSWTWLSCPVPVDFDFAHRPLIGELREIKNHVVLIDCKISWEASAYMTPVKSTELILKGPIRELFIEVPPEAEHFNPPYCNINHEVMDSSKDPIPWRCQVQFDREDKRFPNTWTCLLLRTSFYSEHQSRTATFLLLEILPGMVKPATFRRIGLAIFTGGDELFDSAEQQEIHVI